MLDNYIQLHEHVEIHYIVDHYSADYYVQDGNVHAASGKGDDIESALKELDEMLMTQTLEAWRSVDHGPVTVKAKPNGQE